MSGFDPRVTPARADLAAADLEGLVSAFRYVPRRPHTVVAPVADLAFAPGDARESQLLYGERFDLLDTRDGFAWGQAARDGYVGWVPADALRGDVPPPTHRVIATTAWLFESPTSRAAATLRLGLNTLVAADEERDGFARTPGGWAALPHLAPIGSHFPADPVAVAERLIGAPYVWGGRDSSGLDCSGLVQAALFACGRGCPRDSDQQEAALGRPLAEGEAPRRGDLAFWDGHVGLMTDAETLLHANAWRMAVACEPLAEAAVRQGSAPRLRRVLG